MQQAARTLTALALGAALAVPALALAGGNKAGADFATMDTDQDGRISATEHSAGLEKKFAKLDTDGDGSISSLELSAKGKADRFARLDIDGDGDLSRQEFTARGHFAQLDANGDGFLSRSELESDATAMIGVDPESDSTAFSDDDLSDEESTEDAESTAQEWE